MRRKLSLSIAMTVLLTVALISLLANFFISKQFVSYVTAQQQQKTQEIVAQLNSQAVPAAEQGQRHGMGRMGHHGENASSLVAIADVETIGKSALYEGYIVTVLDRDGATVWDAEKSEQGMCRQVRSTISTRMESSMTPKNGQFSSSSYPLLLAGVPVGTVEISHYGPYFLSETDFQFLGALNRVLLGVGAAALVVAVLIGFLMASRLSRPILKTAKVAGQMAAGDYKVRITEGSSTLELDQLMVSINHLAETLDKQEALRKRLTGDLAHELRTPLTTMSTHIEAMIEGVWEPTTARLESCNVELERITAMVKDLENLAQVESENLQLDKVPLDLWTLVDQGLASYDYDIAAKELEVLREGPHFEVLADPIRLYQVVHNLISNAVKYTNHGGEIRVTVERVDGFAQLSVADNGIGIDPEELPFVFERFYRTDKSRGRATGGSGIGMTIVRSITEAHGGQVTAASCPGAGSVFTVQIPLGM